MPDGLERTRYILGRLTHRPAYYIWFNPDKEMVLPSPREPKDCTLGRSNDEHKD
jgi:hypothetical protein